VARRRSPPPIAGGSSSNGAPDFAALQAALSEQDTDALIFYAFDLLFDAEADLREGDVTEARTATIQEITSANATTAKSENVYSPAALLAKPIGTKPAIVTNVPVNMGNAVEV
jgi:ATP-dependent DNA ligase